MKKILVKTSQYEIDFNDLCNKQYKKINGLLGRIEQDLSVEMNDYQDLRHEILDISNFIKRLPTMISEVVNNEN